MRYAVYVEEPTPPPAPPPPAPPPVPPALEAGKRPRAKRELVAGHAVHIEPLTPHSATAVPGWQTPLDVQQPPQMAGLHVELVPHDDRPAAVTASSASRVDATT